MNNPPERATTTRIRVVLVGESDDVARLGRTLSRGDGLVSIAAVPTGTAAIAHVDRADCLLTDPEHVSTLSTATDVPIVSLSTDGTKEIEAGAADVVSPTAPFDVVRTRIRNALDARSGGRDRTARFRGVLDACEAAIVLSDGDGTIEWVSGSVDRLLDYTPATLVGNPVESLVVAGDRESMSQGRLTVSDAPQNDSRHISARIRGGDDRSTPCSIEVRNRLADPDVNGLVWTIVPTGGRPIAREEAEAEIDHVGDPILTVDADWIVRRANEAARRVYATDEDHLVGHEIWDLLEPSTVDTWFERLSEARTSGSSVSFDVPRSDGGVDSVVVYPADDSLTVVVHPRDESPAGRYRTELERTAGLLDAIADPAVLVDDDRITTANAAVFEYTDHSTVVGRTIDALVGEQLASEIRTRSNAPVRRVDPIEWRPTVDGRERVVLLTVGPVADDRTAVVGRDVTNERRIVERGSALAETIDAVRSVSTVEATRRELLQGIITATGTTAGVWYQRDDDQLSPRTNIGPFETNRAPSVSVASSRLDEIFADGPIRLPRSVHVPVAPKATIAGPLAVPVSDTDVIFVGETETEAETIDTERMWEKSSRPERREPESATDVASETTANQPAFSDWVTRPADTGTERPPELTAFATLVRTVVQLSLARARCLDKTRELTASVSLESAMREQMVTLAERRASTYRALTSARTRSGLEQALCDEVAEIGDVSASWLVSGPADERTARAHAGVKVDGSGTDTDPDFSDSFDRVVDRAITGESQQIERVDDRDDTLVDRSIPGGNGNAFIATPLDGSTGRDGVLVVHATIADDESILPRFCTDVVTVAGLAIDAIAAQRALHADETLEVELGIPRSTDEVLIRLVSEAERPIDVDSVVPIGEHVTYYITVHDMDEASLVDVVDDVPECTLTTSYVPENGELRAELVVEPDPFFEIMSAHGAVLTGITPRDETISIRLELPATRDVRSVVESVRTAIPDVELLARRPVQSPRGSDRPVGTLLAELTDRQREIARTAYAAGYFESPRERTGEEIAETLGISQPTFTRHFRAAERSIFGALFDQDSTV